MSDRPQQLFLQCYYSYSNVSVQHKYSGFGMKLYFLANCKRKKRYTINGTELLRTNEASSSHDEPAIRTMKYKQVKPKKNQRE
jgi:hypothetical protein